MTKPQPKIGQKVYPLPNDEGSWLGLPEPYQNKIGVVTETGTIGSMLTIRAEFKSYSKPDDTVSWHFRNFNPAYELGDTVRVIGGHAPDMIGRIGTVTNGTNPTSSLVRVKSTSPSMPEEAYYFDIKDVEPVLDGETATVSDIEYVPAVGDNVRITGILTDDGIVDGEWFGTVTIVNGGAWIIHTTDSRNVCSGPGYVFPVDVIEEQPAAPAIDLAEAVRKVSGLERELERANQRVTALSERAGKWERDFDRVTAAVLQEAIDRDWCEEYERVMSGIQSDLEIGTIPEREQEYEVEVDITASISYTTTVTVTARSQEDAEEILKDNMDSYVDDPESVLSNNLSYASIDSVECEVL